MAITTDTRTTVRENSNSLIVIATVPAVLAVFTTPALGPTSTLVTVVLVWLLTALFATAGLVLVGD